MTFFNVHSAISLSKSLLISLLLLAPLYSVAAPVESAMTVPNQQNQVAFVPFSNDSILFPVILNDLNRTELKVTNRDLPHQPHSSSELINNLSVWQKSGIPFLVVGNTRIERKKVIIDYEVIDIKSGRVIEGKQTLSADYNARSMRYAAHSIADKIYEIITDSAGDFARHIAYIEETGVGKNKLSRLKVMDADGENAKTITEVQGSLFSPAWSPDGNRIAYSVQREKSFPTIYIQNIDGGGATSITPYKCTNISPSFSPDGSKILFSGSHETSTDIYEIDANGGNLKKVIDWSSIETQPNYAPDGKSFVFVSDKAGFNRPQIYRYEFDSGRTTKVANSSYATSPQFSSDGSKIGFLSGSSVVIMDNNGTIIANLGSMGIDEGVSFSPSGKRIVYATVKDGKSIVVIKSLNGGDSFAKAGQGIIRSPVWSASPNK